MAYYKGAVSYTIEHFPILEPILQPIFSKSPQGVAFFGLREVANTLVKARRKSSTQGKVHIFEDYIGILTSL